MSALAPQLPVGGRDRGSARTASVRATGSGLAERSLLVLAALVAVASAAVTWAVHAGDPDVLPLGWRAAVEVAAITLVPGVPLVVLLRPSSRAVGAALAVSSSWAVTVLAAQGTLVAGWWHPAATSAVLDATSLALCALAWARLPRAAAPLSEGLRRLLPSAARWTRSRVVPLTALAVAVVLFLSQAATVDLDDLGPFGLITAVRWPYVAALALVALVWAHGLLAPRPDHALLVLITTVLSVVTTSLVSLADGRSAVPTGFVHRTFISYITSLERLPPPIDARFDWAGFFAGSAHVVAAAGLGDATSLMSPAPVVAGVLMTAPLYVIGRALTGRARSAWVGVLLYQVTNWYQQDYFAPQMVAQLWFVTTTAVLLWWWRAGRAPAAPGNPLRRALRALRTTPARPPGTGVGGALGTEALLVLLSATMVVTHQLTPMVLVAVLLAFTVTGSTRFRLLWLTAAVAFTAWFSFGAQDYWGGHLADLLGDIGQVSGSVSGGVGDRIGSLPSRQVGQGLRIASSGGLFAVAALAWLLRRKRPGWVLTGLLAAIPFGLVAVQSYGGEVVIRCFLLATPVLAPLAADLLVVVGAALAQRRARHRGAALVSRTSLVLVALLVVAGSGYLTLTRGLNTSFERTTVEQDVVGGRLLEAVPRGTRIIPLGNAPWLGGPRSLDQVVVGFTGSDSAGGADCTTTVLECLERVYPEYVVATPQMDAQALYMLGDPPGWLAQTQQRLVQRDGYVVAYQSNDLTILRRSDVTLPEGVR